MQPQAPVHLRHRRTEIVRTDRQAEREHAVAHELARLWNLEAEIFSISLVDKAVEETVRQIHLGQPGAGVGEVHAVIERGV